MVLVNLVTFLVLKVLDDLVSIQNSLNTLTCLVFNSVCYKNVVSFTLNGFYQNEAALLCVTMGEHARAFAAMI